RATQASRNRSGESLLAGCCPDGPAAHYRGPLRGPPDAGRRGPGGFKKLRGSDSIVLRGRCCSPPVVWRVRRARARRALAMITLTTNAAQKVKGILEQEKENIPQGGLRIYVQGGGCSGFSYGMVLDEAADGDQVFEREGIKVIVDPMSLR